MQGKFEINWDYYQSDKSKLIYAENRVGGKTLQLLKPCLSSIFIISLTIINNLFNYFEDIFYNPS